MEAEIDMTKINRSTGFMSGNSARRGPTIRLPINRLEARTYRGGPVFLKYLKIVNSTKLILLPQRDLFNVPR